MCALRLSKAQKRVLRALADGGWLKSHRYLDGIKVYKLHFLDSPPETVGRSAVDGLHQCRLIYTNQKFPAATYSLTEAGRAVAATLEEPEK